MSMGAWPPEKTAASNLKPSGKSGNAIYYTFPVKGTFALSKKITARRSPLSRRDGMIEHFESMKDAMLIVSRLKAKRYQILDVKGNVVKKGG